MSAGNSAYSPLPQSNSDSDGSSEEELHVLQGNRIVNRGGKVHNLKDVRENKDKTNNSINFKPFDEDADVAVTLNKFLSSPDKVSVLEPEGALEIFSTSRKICFVFSLMLCIFTTVAFLWILPCNVDTCLNVKELKGSNFLWETNLLHLEIYGPINIVSDLNKNENLIFLTKIFQYSDYNSESGVICLKETSGAFCWKKTLKEEPSDLDCKLFDFNADGCNDCLVHGRNLLKALNSLSGNELWDIQKAQKIKYKLHFTDFPVVIPDLDKDGIKELILSCSFDLKNSQSENNLVNNIVIISGKTGIIINEPLLIKSCFIVKNLVLENGSLLSYTCVNSNEKESYQNISLSHLYETLKVSIKGNINFTKWDLLNQHKNDFDTIATDGFKLMLKNEGKCPEECELLVDVRNEHGSLNNKSFFSLKEKNAYGMKPHFFKTNQKSGFIVKFWKWNLKAENFQQDLWDNSDYSVGNPNEISLLRKKRKTFQHLLKSSKILDKEMLLESKWEFQKPSLIVNDNELKDANSVYINFHEITEIIIKIDLNNSHPYVQNLTTNEIIQICKNSEACEPNVNRQKYSVLIAYTSKNNRGKLITYTSKYDRKNKSEGWQMMSQIRILSL